MPSTSQYGEWLEAQSVKQSKVFLDNNLYLQGRNNADSADLDLMRVNASDQLEFGILAVSSVTVDGSSPNAAYATKEYVLNVLAGGRDPKDAVQAASVGNINIAAPGAAIDGVTLSVGDRILLKDQTLPAENGIYDWNGAAVPATRSDDANADGEITNGTSTLVSGGTVNARRQYMVATADPIVVGTTALSWVRIPNPADLVIQQEEKFTLDLTDLDTNGFVDLSVTALHPSVIFVPKGGPIQEKAVDYTLADAGAGGVTRITFGLGTTAGTLGEKLKEIRTAHGASVIMISYERLAG